MTLKEIASEMTKVRNLSTIIEKKKEEFLRDRIKIQAVDFLEKAIRESVEEALREVRPGKEFQWLVTVEKDGWLLNLSPQVVHDDKVKEFMK